MSEKIAASGGRYRSMLFFFDHKLLADFFIRHPLAYSVDVHQLASNAGDPAKHLLPRGAVQSNTDIGAPGYVGAAPPDGPAHRYLITVFSFLSFSFLFVYWFYSSLNANIDNSGMGLIIAVPPLLLTALLLFMSSRALFYDFKKGQKISRGNFIMMGLLSLPVFIFGILCVILLVDWSS